VLYVKQTFEPGNKGLHDNLYDLRVGHAITEGLKFLLLAIYGEFRLRTEKLFSISHPSFFNAESDSVKNAY